MAFFAPARRRRRAGRRAREGVWKGAYEFLSVILGL